MRLLLLSAGVLELVFAFLAARSIDRETSFPIYLGCYLAMSIFWLIASYLCLREPRSGRADLALVFGFGLALRGVLLFTEPVLSDDIFRYVWDGRVQKAGINPYLHAPADPELAPLRSVQYEGINNKDIPTIYPPLMQLAFLLAVSISESVRWMKAFFVLFDVGIVVCLMGLLSALRLNPLRALIYAWSPLAAVEVAGSGHNDAFAVFFFIASLWALERGRVLRSAALLAASGMAKLVGFALAPLYLRYLKPRALAVIPLAALLLVLPYAPAGKLAFRGLREYGMRWRGNDSAFHLLFLLSGSLDRAKLLVAALLVALVVLLALRKETPLRACYWTLGAILILTPTVHPWYLLWIAPLLAIFPNPAWLYLQAAIGLSYHALYLARPGQAWEELPWVKLLEYLPFFALLGLHSFFHEPRANSRNPHRGRAG